MGRYNKASTSPLCLPESDSWLQRNEANGEGNRTTAACCLDAVVGAILLSQWVGKRDRLV